MMTSDTVLAPEPLRIPTEVARKAVHWMLELQENPADSELAEQCWQWRQSNPLHESAWQHIFQGSRQLRSLGQAEAQALRQTLLSPTLSRRDLARMLALLGVVSAVGWQSQSTLKNYGVFADFKTSTGEQTQFSFADIELQLNTDTALDTWQSGGARYLSLYRGEVSINIPEPVPVPLMVKMPGVQLMAGQGHFIIRNMPGVDRVDVYSGQVEVSRNGQRPWSVIAGERMDFNRNGLLRRESLDPYASTWREGMLVVSNMPLQTFLGEVSRYRSGHIRCHSTIADLRISGSYPLADTDAILDSLAGNLSLSVRRLTPWWVSVERAV